MVARFGSGSLNMSASDVLAKNQRDQAGAKQDKAGNGYGQETVGGELVTHIETRR